MDIERQEFPKLHQARVTVEEPKLSDLEGVLGALLDDGVPSHATLRFSKWNNPDTTYYIIANWTEDE